eukprot:757120-Hanusia_phi.AAC.5
MPRMHEEQGNESRMKVEVSRKQQQHDFIFIIWISAVRALRKKLPSVSPVAAREHTSCNKSEKGRRRKEEEEERRGRRRRTNEMAGGDQKRSKSTSRSYLSPSTLAPGQSPRSQAACWHREGLRVPQGEDISQPVLIVARWVASIRQELTLAEGEGEDDADGGALKADEEGEARQEKRTGAGGKGEREKKEFSQEDAGSETLKLTCTFRWRKRLLELEEGFHLLPWGRTVLEEDPASKRDEDETTTRGDGGKRRVCAAMRGME